MQTASRYYGTRDAAEQVGMSRPTVQRLCQQHEIGTVVGTARVLTESDLERLRSVRPKIGRPRKKGRHE